MSKNSKYNELLVPQMGELKSGYFLEGDTKHTDSILHTAFFLGDIDPGCILNEKTREPRRPWIAHLRNMSRVTVESLYRGPLDDVANQTSRL